MNILKAIEIKTRTGEQLLNTDPDEIHEADRLSIEALIYALADRGGLSYCEIKLLPGETKY